MKRIKALTGILLLVLLLFCGCGNQPEDTTTSTSIETTTTTMETTTTSMETTTTTQETTTSTTTTQETTTTTQETTTTTLRTDGYEGFMTPQVGNWVEYEQEIDQQALQQLKEMGEIYQQEVQQQITDEDVQQMNDRNTAAVKKKKTVIEVVREENYEGTECLVLEMEIQDGVMITQAWISKDTREIKRYVMKAADKVYCLGEASFSENMPEGIKVKGTPEEYSPDQSNISYGTYTTDAGTTVDVAKFQTEEGETWVSSEVPFGIVKTMPTDGQVTRLSEFSYTGASSDISQSEIANCQGMQTSP